MQGALDIRVLPDAEAVALAAARLMARRIRDAARRGGVCRVAVSGGSTPAALFDALVGLDVPWSSVVLHQVDERVAPDGSPDRNATQLEQHLLEPLRSHGRGPARRNVRLLPVGSTDLSRAARSAGATIDAATPLDLVHLGLGDDGHTASWPPGVEIPQGPHTPAVVAVGPFNGLVRLTLTPRVVNAARMRLVVAAGAAKADAVSRWLLDDPGVPVQMLRRAHTVVVLDEAAAASVAPWTSPR